MLILGIESSCDDTSVALVDCSDRGHVIISEKTASQIDVHKKYGGVVPEIAGRMHAEIIVPLIEAVLTNTPPSLPTGQAGPPVRGDLLAPPWPGGTRGVLAQSIRPDVIAVTAGPGLITGLIVGVEAARTLSYAWNIPVVAVNHLAGHIHSVEISNDKLQISNKIQNPNIKNNNVTMKQCNNASLLINQLTNKLINEFPALALVVSGGHTELVVMENHTTYQRIGATKDDAAGECFDKVAKLIGLPYPGGPQISQLAETGRTDAIVFPRPMLKDANLDFSFAGLKTSALYWLRDNTPHHPPARGEPTNPPWQGGTRGVVAGDITINDFCASFEQAIVDVLVAKTLRAASEIKPKTIILAGGVSANKKLRETLGARVAPTTYHLPPTAYAMDNGAMIAIAGYYQALNKNFTPWQQLGAYPNWRVDSSAPTLS
ncbi:MAG: tRNA (adenosine(37)-N6)-threonylcarbamoyltransferase complex transferase subunit TsaD [Candidatus Magasanikbacteria bacterium]|nr:tRNA (adenosine(37)-N6)-threonylcarbamoyltransferase complex transferase subunit TsaD [Candidatus Magasanikbacteria bacterium]